MTNTHNDIQIGDRVIGRSNCASFLAGESGTVVESPNAAYPFAVRFDNEDKFPDRISANQKGIRHWSDASYFEPAPIKVGDWVRVISVPIFGNTDKIGHKFEVLEINHYGTVTETKPDQGHGGSTWTPEYLRAIVAPTGDVDLESLASEMRETIEQMASANESMKVDFGSGRIFISTAEPMESWTVRNDLRWNTETGRLEVASQSTLGNVRWDEVPNYTPPADHSFKVGNRVTSSITNIIGTIEAVERNKTRINWDVGGIFDWTDKSCKQFLKLAPKFKRGDRVEYTAERTGDLMPGIRGRVIDVIDDNSVEVMFYLRTIPHVEFKVCHIDNLSPAP